MTPYPQTNRTQSDGVGVAVPARPVIYEINTRLWLRELSRLYGRPITLGEVPAEVWAWLAGFRFDVIWLMGVWERSAISVDLTWNDAPRLEALAQVLPAITADDISGTPTSVRRYVVDEALGGAAGLAAARAELARRGIALMLDYSPNHVALDHPWVSKRPAYFIQGQPDDLLGEPPAYFQAGDAILAHSRDPNFPPWRDMAQLNVFSPAVRAAAVADLCTTAAQCDVVCCQLAMLLTNYVFAGTWGERAGPPPDQEYWREVLPAVRASQPQTIFVAEAYWDMEWEMLQQGFDFSYDKRLYDRLVHEGPESVRGHLLADLAYQERLVRFIENPYEPRAAATFPANRALAAAVAAYTLPGAKLFHQGQFEGYTTRLPLALTRRPEEPIDRALQAFYRRLVLAIQSPALRDGQWRLCALNGWPDNYSYNNLVAWCWQLGDERRIIVVNLSPHTCQARLQLPWPELAGQNWVLHDIMEERLFEYAGDEILNMGLFVELAPWGRHFFAIR